MSPQVAAHLYRPPTGIGAALIGDAEWVTDSGQFALGAWLMRDYFLWRRRWAQAADALWFGYWRAR